MAVGELLVGAIDGAVSPVIAVGNKVIDLVPLPLKNWAVDTFGTSDKVVLIVTTLAILFVAGIAVGIESAAGRRTVALAATAVIGLLGVGAVLTRSDPTIAKLLPIVVATLVSAAALWWLSAVGGPAEDVTAPRPWQAVATVGQTDEQSPIEPTTPVVVPGAGSADRRVFLLRSLGVASVAAIAGGTGRLLQRRYDVGGERAVLALPPVADRRPAAALPPNADPAVDGLSPFVTPNADFYRIDTALLVPQLSKDEWSLRIHGMVEHELELTFDDLLAREQIEAYVTLACVSNPVGGPYVGNALWQGVRLADILAEVGVDPASTQLLSTSVDGWTCGTPVSSLIDGRNAHARHRDERRTVAARARLPGADGRAGRIRLRLGDEVGRRHGAHHVGSGQRLLGPSRLVAAGSDEDDDPYRGTEPPGNGCRRFDRDRRHGLCSPPRHLRRRGASRRR